MPEITNKGKVYIPLFILCAVSLILFLGATPFNTRGEPREAVVAMSMLGDGNWILPVNNGDEIAFKPPLLHWLVAAFSWLLGGISEFTSRLPSALAATGMIVGTFAFFARRKGTTEGMLTALLLLTCFEVHRAAMTCRVDMLLAALMVGALFCLYRWGERGLRGVPLTAILCLAGAALTKGPVGIVLPCAAVALYLWLTRRATFLSLLWKFALVAVVALLPLLLWYYAAYLQPHGGDRFLALIYEENVLRFTGKMSYASHENPWYYNVMTVLTGMLPYTIAALCALPLCLRALSRKCKGGLWQKLRTARPLDAWRRLDAADGFALMAFIVIFVFYCIPASKRSVYLLPLYPFVCYFTARLLIALGERHARTMHAFCVTLGTVGIVLPLAFMAVRFGLVPDTVFHGSHAAENAAYLHALAAGSVGAWGIVLPALTFLLAVCCIVHRRRPRLFTVAALVFVIQMTLDGVFIPRIMEVKTDRDIAVRIRTLQPEGTVYSFRTDVLEANRLHPFTINFYLGDRVIPIDKAPALPATALLIVGNEEIEDFLKAYPQYAATLVYDSHHRSCDDHKTVRLYRIALGGEAKSGGQKKDSGKDVSEDQEQKEEVVKAKP